MYPLKPTHWLPLPDPPRAALLASPEAHQRVSELKNVSPIEVLASELCQGNRHEGFVGNCPVCMDRLLRIRRALVCIGVYPVS